MESFKEFVGGSERVETAEELLEEGAIRNLGSVAIMARIVSLSKRIQRTKEVGKQNALLAKQNVYLAALGLVVGELLRR